MQEKLQEAYRSTTMNNTSKNITLQSNDQENWDGMNIDNDDLNSRADDAEF